MITLETRKSAFIADKKTKENRWHYHVRPSDRWAALDSWKYCESIGHPLNVLLEIEFTQAEDPSLDAGRVRRLLQYCRVAIKQGLGIEHYAMWSRHVARGTSVEKDMLLVSVPDDALAWFKHAVQGWKFDGVDKPVKVTSVDYSRCIEFQGKLYTTFEVMTRNLDPITRRAEPCACYEPSEPVYKPNLFYSLKVEKAMRQGKVPIVMIDN